MLRGSFAVKVRQFALAALSLSLVALTPLALAATSFRTSKLEEMDAAISLAITEGRCPGGVLWLEHNGEIYKRAYGSRAIDPEREPMTEDTIFDLASLTKVIATTTAVMKLVEQGTIDLSAPVSKYVPDFAKNGKEAITVEHLMTHTSGLRPGLSLGGKWSGEEGALALACEEKPTDPPGARFRYSDINFIVLGEVVRIVSGRKLQDFCQQEIFAPLGMKDTGYLPAPELQPRIAPTERRSAGVLRGVVHDPTSSRMGGVAGHAGLFSTAADLARFSRMILGKGELEGVRILKEETVRLMTSVHTPAALPRRGLGWDIDSPYAGPRGAWFPIGSFGHTGWTGGSLWIDPFSNTFVIFLSNRNHPTEAGNVLGLRRVLSTLACEAIADFNFAFVPGALPSMPATGVDFSRKAPPVDTVTVSAGIDVLKKEGFARLKGKRVGLVTNQTGIDRDRNSTIDLLFKAPDVKLTELFSPEHGIRGVADEKIGDSRDEKTGLPIFSLYGESRMPSEEQMKAIDVLVFDIQDIGCRFYTYISTLGECLTASAKAGVPILVLDRPNPIGGLAVEGPVLTGTRSFVGWHEIPVRHGMTIGELARMFNEERAIGASLEVVACENWQRGLWYDQTTLPWVNPSPNMRSLNAAVLYPGVGLLEFCNLSVGRGTDRPFERLGAPYIDDVRLASELNSQQLAGVRFVPVRFTPQSSVFAGKECRGVEMIVTDRTALNSVELGLTIARILQRSHPGDLKLEKMSRLLFHPPTLEGLTQGEELSRLKTSWVADRESFQSRREKYLLYR